MTNEFPLDPGGFLTTKGQAALRKRKRGFGEALGDDGDVTDLIDFAYIPEFREAAKRRGYDALTTDKDFVPGGTPYTHDTMVPLDFRDVTAIGGILDDLLKRKIKYGK